MTGAFVCEHQDFYGSSDKHSARILGLLVNWYFIDNDLQMILHFSHR